MRPAPRPPAVLTAALLVAALAACAVQPGPGHSSRATEVHPGGALFSTIACARTPLGEAWARLRPQAEARFPALRLTRVEDLHLTVVYVGKGWRQDELDRIRALAVVAPRETVSFRPEVVRMGRDGQVVAIELHGASEAWVASVVAAKGELNRLGLKRPDPYDATFRPHVTLASAQMTPPGTAEIAALDEIRTWVAREVAADEERFRVTFDPATPVRLWLAGTPRPPGAPEYVDLEDALAGPGPPTVGAALPGRRTSQSRDHRE